eukprot:1796442-Amphidinium_carterae.1
MRQTSCHECGSARGPAFWLGRAVIGTCRCGTACDVDMALQQIVVRDVVHHVRMDGLWDLAKSCRDGGQDRGLVSFHDLECSWQGVVVPLLSGEVECGCLAATWHASRGLAGRRLRTS